MRHDDPPTAVRFAVMAAAATLQAQILFADGVGRSALHADVIVAETTRAFTRYLGIAA